MTKKQPAPKWVKQTYAKDYRMLECPSYNPIEDFKSDPAGCYVLIRTNAETSCIEAAVCNKDHKIMKGFRGRKSQDVYDAIFNYEKKHHVKWFQEKTHIAYLGKELKKAELALSSGNNVYIQE